MSERGGKPEWEPNATRQGPGRDVLNICWAQICLGGYGVMPLLLHRLHREVKVKRRGQTGQKALQEPRQGKIRISQAGIGVRTVRCWGFRSGGVYP